MLSGPWAVFREPIEVGRGRSPDSPFCLIIWKGESEGWDLGRDGGETSQTKGNPV